MTQTHFGYQTVEEEDKVHKVADVFHSVAARYDVMNDLMSAGLHRIWKAFTIAQAGIRPGFKVLDIAGGTGDLAMAFAKKPARPAKSGLPTSTNRCCAWAVTACSIRV